MTEVSDFLAAGIPAGFGEAVIKMTGGSNPIEKSRSHINHVDTPSRKGALAEFSGIETFYHIDVRSIVPHIIVHQESLVRSIYSVVIIVYRRDGVEIPRHQPILSGGIRHGGYGLLADVLNLPRAENISALGGGRCLLVLRQIGIALGPGMQGHKVKFARFAQNVWDIRPEGKSDEQLAAEGIAALEAWMKEIGVVMHAAELGVTNDTIEAIADSTIIFDAGYHKLTRDEVIQILKESM